MKIKAINILPYALLLITTIVNGQGRINKQTLSFDSKTNKLANATGWKLNGETGKWIENTNVIDGIKCPMLWVSHITQNFKWIQFASLTHNGNKYYVFLWERLGGKYKYESIQMDWEQDNRTYFFILDSKQYSELKAAVNAKEQKDIQFNSNFTGHISDCFKVLGGEHLYNEENLLAKITNSLGKKGYSNDCLTINAQNVDGKDIVRFLLPENCFSTKYSYFEVSFEDFMTILTF